MKICGSDKEIINHSTKGAINWNTTDFHALTVFFATISQEASRRENIHPNSLW